MLSTTAEYALRIMIVMTESGDSTMTSERIAEETNVPADYAVKVLQWLGRGHLVKGRRGRGGGFRMACDPEVTTLLDVVNLIDPIHRLDSCPLGREEHSGKLCPLHQRIDEVLGLLEESLGSMTLNSVVDGQKGPPLCRLEPQSVSLPPARRREKVR